mmetsp:Transcript_5172/g.15770  ORF Transcript_5172/g.15770 Transcript_5172/m.15770 type:complete len:224 (-) Transcript_5172:584-1255(-)
MSLETLSTMAGVNSAPASEPPPCSALASRAPRESASAIIDSRMDGFDGSGNGVILTPSSHGSPTRSCATAVTSFSTKTSATSSWTMMSLMAVHRCPLYERLPRTHWATAESRSASGSTMPRFLPSSWAKTLRRCGAGWAAMRASAPLVPPMKPSTSMRPVCMIGPIVWRPEPDMKLITPGGSVAAKALAVRMCTRPPIAGSLRTAVLPIRSAGMSMAYISFSG